MFALSSDGYTNKYGSFASYFLISDPTIIGYWPPPYVG